MDAAPVIERFVTGRDLTELPDNVISVLAKKYEWAADGKPWFLASQNEQVNHYLTFKTRVTINQQPALFLDLFPRIKPIFILLRRKNKIKNAISQYKHSQLKISHLQHFEKNSSKRLPVKVDTTYILKQALHFTRRELITKHYFEIMAKKTSTLNLEVFYEDLITEQGYLAVFKDLFVKLRIEMMPLDSEYRKITPDSIQQAISNFKELEKSLSGTAFEPS